MNEAGNVEKLKRAYRLWDETKGGSVQDWIQLMDSDVRLKSPGSLATGKELAAGCNGLAEAEAYFSGLATEWEMVHCTPEEFIAQGDTVVVLGHVAFRSKRTGKVASSTKADVFRFRDGKIVEFVEFFDTLAAATATMP